MLFLSGISTLDMQMGTHSYIMPYYPHLTKNLLNMSKTATCIRMFRTLHATSAGLISILFMVDFHLDGHQLIVKLCADDTKIGEKMWTWTLSSAVWIKRLRNAATSQHLHFRSNIIFFRFFAIAGIPLRRVHEVNCLLNH